MAGDTRDGPLAPALAPSPVQRGAAILLSGGAAETAIWLTEVAPESKAGKRVLEHLAGANNDANPELMRFALKLATGAGKTTVMAMLIAWQTLNAVRRLGANTLAEAFSSSRQV